MSRLKITAACSWKLSVLVEKSEYITSATAAANCTFPIQGNTFFPKPFAMKYRASSQRGVFFLKLPRTWSL